jgi:mono/diheme cytochrome c family protein
MKVLVGLLFLTAVAVIGVAQQGERTPGNIERGRYIVHDVAQCIQCHTPHDGNGTLLADRLLEGAPIPVRSPFANQDWAYQAPRIAGLPGYTVEEGIRLLTQGVARNGQRPLPPMPQFRMNEQDARDVVAYLRSLP